MTMPRHYDWAWVGKRGRGHWEFIESFRLIKRGKKKGCVEVTLTDTNHTRRIIPSSHLRLNPHHGI